MPSGVPRVPEPREWLLTKRCAGCGGTKPWAEFSPAGYWPDGSVRHVLSRCKACERERKNDPVARLSYANRNRERLRAYWRTVRRRERAALRLDRSQQDPVRLPSGPLLASLAKRAEELGSWSVLADCIGVNDRTLRRIRSEMAVSLSLADRCCVGLGFHLTDVYPELGVVA